MSKDNDRAQEINFDHTIDKFATLKFRKQFFLRFLKLNGSAGGGFCFIQLFLMRDWFFILSYKDLSIVFIYNFM